MKLEIDPKAKALIFDLDGTLADTMSLHLQAWQKTCAGHGFEYPKELFYQLAGLSSVKISELLIKRAGMNDSLDARAFALEKEDAFLSMDHLIKPVQPVVELVYAHNGKVSMAVGTGGNRSAVYKTLEVLDLLKYFPVIVAAEDVEKHKPEPDTFLKCADLMNVPPAVCQVFEDGELGIEAAKRAGMMVVDITPWHPRCT